MKYLIKSLNEYKSNSDDFEKKVKSVITEWFNPLLLSSDLNNIHKSLDSCINNKFNSNYIIGVVEEMEEQPYAYAIKGLKFPNIKYFAIRRFLITIKDSEHNTLLKLFLIPHFIVVNHGGIKSYYTQSLFFLKDYDMMRELWVILYNDYIVSRRFSVRDKIIVICDFSIKQMGEKIQLIKLSDIL